YYDTLIEVADDCPAIDLPRSATSETAAHAARSSSPSDARRRHAKGAVSSTRSGARSAPASAGHALATAAVTSSSPRPACACSVVEFECECVVRTAAIGADDGDGSV